jgi:tetratricopeptide (TPR) repeat protein
MRLNFYLYTLTVIVLLIPVSSKSQVQEDIAKFNRISNEADAFFIKSFTPNAATNEKAKQTSLKSALSRYLELLKLDLAQQQLLTERVAKCYRFSYKHDSAIYYYKLLLKKHKDSLSICSYTESIALCLIEQGYIDSSLNYLNTAFAYCTNDFARDVIFTHIINYAMGINDKSEVVLLKKLKEKSIDPCKYFCRVLRTLLSFSNDPDKPMSYHMTEEVILSYEKKCI